MEIFLFLFIVLRRSQIIALKWSYNDGCRRQHEVYIELCTSM
jgi:hypothetical protein